MPFLVQGSLDDHVLAVTADTANEAFAKAIEWHVVEKFFDVSIVTGTRPPPRGRELGLRYSLA